MSRGVAITFFLFGRQSRAFVVIVEVSDFWDAATGAPNTTLTIISIYANEEE